MDQNISKPVQTVVCLFAFLVAQQLNAATFTYSYDSLNRITNTAYSDGSREGYSYDPAGNRLSRITLAATSLLDTTPPSIPTNLATNLFTPSQLSITWNRAFDTGGSGLAGYQVFINGSFVGTTTGTNFTLSGLSPNSQYCLTVAAFDHDNNISTQSLSLCLTTPVFQPPTLNGFLAAGQFHIGASGGTSGPYDVFGSSDLLNWSWETNIWLPLSNGYFVPPTNVLSPYFYRLSWRTNTP